MAVIVNFAEQQHQNFFEDYEIYIFGERVTPYVKGDVRITITDRDGFNTATFDLDNALDRFLLTPENLGMVIADNGTVKKIEPIWRMSEDGAYSEAIKKRIYDWKNDDGNNPPDSMGVRQYPLNVYGNIFTKNDPVRIAIHNPLTEEDQWFWRFTGFIDAKPADEDYVMGSQSLRITAYCIKALAQRMRINQIPVGMVGIQVQEQILDDPDSFFRDLDRPTEFTNPLANKKFETAMHDLIVGNAAEGRNGIGYFKKGVKSYFVTSGADGLVSEFRGETSVNSRNQTGLCKSLEDWYAICLLGVEKRFLSFSEIDAVGRETYPGGKYWPVNGMLHMLLPSAGTGAENLVEFEHARGGSATREWITRYDAICDLCNRIDYQWWTAGNGDIIVEFPMYDFHPNDFGEFRTVLTVDQHVKSGSLDEDSGEVVTAICVTGSIGWQDVNGYRNYPQGLQPRAIVGSTNLARRVGVNMQTHPLPFCDRQDTLVRLGYIELQKRLADANKVGVTFTFRPFLLPNKPFYHRTRLAIGLTTAVTDSLTTHERAETNIDMRYLRRMDTNGKFRFITGGESVPISYNTLYGYDKKKNATVNSGVASSTKGGS